MDRNHDPRSIESYYRKELLKLLEEKKAQNAALQKIIDEMTKDPDNES